MGVFAGIERNWASQTNTGRTHIATKGIVQSGLVLNLDAGVSSSYSGSGTTLTDLSGNGNTGTLTNGPTYSSANGGSLVFDGSNDYVSVSSTTALNWGIGNWTFDVWFFLPSSYSNNNLYATIFDSPQFFVGVLRSGLTGVPGFYTSGLGYGFISSSYATYIFGAYTYSCAGKWTNLTLSKNESTSYCYLNGSLYASKTTGAYSNQSNSGRYGIKSSNELPLNGNIASTKIYNRALTAAEIQQNFNATRSRFSI